jgi:hypothetical protein
VWKNYKKPEGTVKGQSRGPCVQKRPRDEEWLLSTLGTWGCDFQRFHQGWFHSRRWTSLDRFCIPFFTLSAWTQRSRHSKESRTSVMF